ncbi:uncharacterized protein LOC143288244 [Babylonia areolata]|uniref:uncharacterized protein LOC143288244 n=1 Tax=Babylonia areolata TaxID=304850 RepID=UPI003FD1531F
MTRPSCSACLLLVLCGAPIATRGAIFTAEETGQIHEFIQTAMACSQIPGLSLAVVRGEERWTEGYGVEDVSSGRPVSSASLFGVGSLTKAFTVSLLALLLNETSGVSWETPLAAILGPDFRLGDDYITEHVTLKDLLTHRTGLSASILPMYVGVPDNMSLELLEKRIRHLPTSAPFRDGYAYNDFMYTLAGRVAEVLGGASWEELLRTRLLQPMKMEHTTLVDPEMKTNDLATTYMEAGGKLVELDTSLYTDVSAYRSCGGMVSSADDMSHWMHVLLHHGVTSDGARVLPEKAVQKMQTAEVLLPRKDGHFLHRPQFPVLYSDVGYGLAWFTAVYREYPVVYHPGGIFAFTSLLAFIPDLDLGIFIATNGPGYQKAFHVCNSILFHLTDLVLGLESWLSPLNVCDFQPHPAPDTSTSTNPTHSSSISLSDSSWKDAQAYLGSYGNRLIGDLVVSEGSAHGLLLRLNELSARLHKTVRGGVLAGEVLGGRSFLSMGGGVNETLFLTLRFLNGDGEGRYQRAVITFPNDPQDWTFQRGVYFHIVRCGFYLRNSVFLKRGTTPMGGPPFQVVFGMAALPQLVVFPLGR